MREGTGLQGRVSPRGALNTWLAFTPAAPGVPQVSPCDQG